MKLLKISLISFLAIFSLVLSPAVFAEEQKVDESVKISNIFINKLSISSQKDNLFDISFVLKNGDGAHANSKTSIELVDSNQKIVDRYVSPKIFTIEPNSEATNNFSYSAPFGLSGDYSLRLLVVNDSGIPLAANSLEVNFNRDSSFIELIPDTCFLVSSSNNENKVAIDKTLTLEKSENIILSCQIKNNLKENIELNPVYETHKDNLYGEAIDQKYQKEEIIILADEEKSISLTIPTVLSSGDYVTQVSLKQGNKIYNRMLVKYSIGERELVKIKNISLDKTSYKKGEEMNLSVLFNYLSNKDASLKMNVSVLNKKGDVCLPSFTEITPSSSTFLSFKKELKLDCNDPLVTIKITNESDELLAQKDMVFESVKKIDRTLIIDIVVLTLIVILVVAGIIIFFVKPKNKKEELKNNENINNETNNQ